MRKRFLGMCWLSTRPAQTRRQVASLEQTSGNCYEGGLTNNHVMVGEEPTDFQMSFTALEKEDRRVVTIFSSSFQYIIHNVYYTLINHDSPRRRSLPILRRGSRHRAACRLRRSLLLDKREPVWNLPRSRSFDADYVNIFPERFLTFTHEECSQTNCPASCSRLGPEDVRLYLGVTRRSYLH